MYRLLTLNIFLLGLLLGGVNAATAAESPQFTQMSNPDNFVFSGFANLTYNAPAGTPITLSLDDLSVFGNGHVNNLINPFFETEISGATLLQQGGDPASAGTAQLSLERIYNDSYLTNSVTLRFGKMLSPVGEWNLIHAPPLVWTTTRPMTTTRGFSNYTSGISLLYNDSKGVLPDAQLYFQPGNEIYPTPTSLSTREYEHVAGTHLNFPFGLNDKLGISFQYAQVPISNEQQNLIGFNFSKELGQVTFETEMFNTQISGTNPLRVRDNEWGGYLQGIYSLNERWHLVGRYESFTDRGYSTASENALLGVVYKSDSRTVWKLEYVEQYGQLLDIQSGLYASFAILF